jgi:hypothetical protein
VGPQHQIGQPLAAARLPPQTDEEIEEMEDELHEIE